MLNINGDQNDEFYRYKMPKLQSHKGGSGNGCFTIIDNLKEVSQSFNHPESVLLKFIGYVLGANVNEKQQKITGHYSDDDLQGIIYRYIQSFVLCEKCEIPEILPYTEGSKKKKKLCMRCSACGKSYDYVPANKMDDKGKDLIMKYLSNNDWKVSKGSMVLQDDFF